MSSYNYKALYFLAASALGATACSYSSSPGSSYSSNENRGPGWSISDAANSVKGAIGDGCTAIAKISWVVQSTAEQKSQTVVIPGALNRDLPSFMQSLTQQTASVYAAADQQGREDFPLAQEKLRRQGFSVPSGYAGTSVQVKIEFQHCSGTTTGAGPNFYECSSAEGGKNDAGAPLRVDSLALFNQFNYPGAPRCETLQ